MEKIPAEHFIATLEVNVDNNKLTDEAFREFVRNTLPIVKGSTGNKKKISIDQRDMNILPR